MNVVLQYSSTIVLLAFFLYRKVKRSIGFQLYQPRRLIFQIVIFSLLSLFVLASCFLHPETFIYVLIGCALGLFLVSYAMKHSKFEVRDHLFYYRTHLWIESSVLLLFLSRFLYRIIILIKSSNIATEMNGLQYSQHFTKDPTTIIILFILIVYYIGYSSFIIRKRKHYKVKL
ncbi:sporulation protein [Bacillus sp. JJ722]|uniref:sporulation protein n=1 Tax=Bacillus sp. JJ722 TaxID=3122973 RepID=UPI002FFEEDA6